MQDAFAIASVVSVLLWCAVHGKPSVQYTLGDHGDERNHIAGTYRFFYEVPGHSRREELRGWEDSDESVSVEGSYSFVSPEGDEYLFKYEADEEGYIVESDALPKKPEDVDAVKQARKEFIEAYCKNLGMEDCVLNEYYDALSKHGEEEEDEEVADNGRGDNAKEKSVKGGSFNHIERNIGN